MKIDLILIYIGTIFPEYIKDCIKQSLLYDYNIHVVISKDLKFNLDSVQNITLVSVEDYINQEYEDYISKKSNKAFRDGFWQSTSSRFFVLKNYTQQNNLKNFIHIEYDNLLFSSLKHELNILQQSIYDMCIVMDSSERCVPSICWFRDFNIINSLTNFMSKKFNLNDMESLGLFYYKNDKVTNFPIVPCNYKLNSVKPKYDNFYSEFTTIFDGAAIGQYLGGVDPRNISGNTDNFINETAVINPSRFKYSWINNELFGEYKGETFKINNMHVHSKNLKRFMQK